MKGKISAIKGKIGAMFATLATTGASLPGTDIRPPARTARDAKGSQCKSDYIVT
jgi:hypothetical protein